MSQKKIFHQKKLSGLASWSFLPFSFSSSPHQLSKTRKNHISSTNSVVVVESLFSSFLLLSPLFLFFSPPPFFPSRICTPDNLFGWKSVFDIDVQERSSLALCYECPFFFFFFFSPSCSFFLNPQVKTYKGGTKWAENTLKSTTLFLLPLSFPFFPSSSASFLTYERLAVEVGFRPCAGSAKACRSLLSSLPPPFLPSGTSCSILAFTYGSAGEKITSGRRSWSLPSLFLFPPPPLFVKANSGWTLQGAPRN